MGLLNTEPRSAKDSSARDTRVAAPKLKLTSSLSVAFTVTWVWEMLSYSKCLSFGDSKCTLVY